jgi:hypothetical protein
MKHSEVKKIITESVLGFFNEISLAPKSPSPSNRHDKDDLGPDQEFLDKQHGVEGGGTLLSPWINKKKKSPTIHKSFKKDEFKPNPPSLNEIQLKEIEEIYKELMKK